MANEFVTRASEAGSPTLWCLHQSMFNELTSDMELKCHSACEKIEGVISTWHVQEGELAFIYILGPSQITYLPNKPDILELYAPAVQLDKEF